MKKSIPEVFLLFINVVCVLFIVGCGKKPASNVTAGPPQFTLASEDIISSVKVVTNKVGTVEVWFKLSDTKSGELLKFSQKYSQEPQTEILVGSEAIMKPGSQSEISISNGEIRVSYPPAESGQAWAVAALLSKK